MHTQTGQKKVNESACSNRIPPCFPSSPSPNKKKSSTPRNQTQRSKATHHPLNERLNLRAFPWCNLLQQPFPITRRRPHYARHNQAQRSLLVMRIVASKVCSRASDAKASVIG